MRPGAVIHGTIWAGQPDILLRCGTWVQPAWTKTCPTPRGVYEHDLGGFYSFDDLLTTCPDCELSKKLGQIFYDSAEVLGLGVELDDEYSPEANHIRKCINEAWMVLITRYAEPHRKYHTLRHIGHVINTFREQVYRPEEPSASEAYEQLLQALFWHDVVYDAPPSPHLSNEVQSVLLFNDRGDDHSGKLGWGQMMGFSDQSVDEISDVVMMTKHDGEWKRRGQMGDYAYWALDCDLMIFGEDPDSYDQYVEQVRQEYSYVSDENWKVGRGGFLTSTLSRPHIFHTADFRRRYDKHARENIGRELKQLGLQP